jgi:hypothetical protein
MFSMSRSTKKFHSWKCSTTVWRVIPLEMYFFCWLSLLLVTQIIKGKQLCYKMWRSNDYFIKILFLLSKWFQTRRCLWEFPIGSYVKLSSAVVAILVGVLKCGTQFWKRTTQESFQQSLVEIDSTVSEENIFS